MYSISQAITLCLALTVTTVGAQSSADSPTATIDAGPLVGIPTQLPDSDTLVNQFLGIPFAQPPVGDLRFLPPQPIQPWEDAYNATSQPVACMQYAGAPGPFTEMRRVLYNTPPPPGESEDCLYLNVYAPIGGETNKSILFWIYGGSNTAGAASLAFYDGNSFAANQDIIVVAANYRVNVFGFPRAPQIPLDERNLGYLDQRLALDWVQRNIHVFGGDPTKVTIMGESAGGVAVGNLINTHPIDPPFRAGVLQSGSAIVKIPPSPPNNDTTVWNRLLERLNCTNRSDEEGLACARAAPASTIQEIINTNGISFSEPVLNNVTALQYPTVEWAAGNVGNVPILIGSTADDGSYFALAYGGNLTAFLSRNFGNGSAISNMIAEAYAPGSPATAGLSTGQEIISKIITDAVFHCSSGFVANITSTTLNVPVWQYVFNASVPSNQWEEYPDLGVYHASEIPLQFGTYARENSTEAEARLSQSIQKQFADFIKDPMTGPGWSQWPDVGVLGVNETGAVTTVDEFSEPDPICAMWNELYALMLASALPTGTNTTEAPSTSSTSDGPTATASSASTASAEPNSGVRSVIDGLVMVGAGLLGMAVAL